MLQDAFRDDLNEAPRALHNSDVNFIYAPVILGKTVKGDLLLYSFGRLRRT